MKRVVRGGLVAAMVAGSVAVCAQTAPAPTPSAPATTATLPATPAGTTPAQPAAESYTYSPEGRRDPFVSLISRGVDPTSGKRSDGLGGLAVGELVVRGVMLSRGAYVALVQGPDNKTYNAHVNDRLLDGTIKSITPQGLVIMQDVNDPLSLVKQREVRKGLRASEDGK